MFRTCFHFYFYFLFCVAELYDFPSKSEFSNRTLLLCVLCVVKHSAALKLPLSFRSVFFVYFVSFFIHSICVSLCVSLFICIILSSVLIIQCSHTVSVFFLCIFIFSLYTSVRCIFNCPIAQNSFRCDSAFNFGLSC